MGYLLHWFSIGTNSSRHFRQSEGARITLKRRSKKRPAAVVVFPEPDYRTLDKAHQRASLNQ
jgi:hypothetical protein